MQFTQKHLRRLIIQETKKVLNENAETAGNRKVLKGFMDQNDYESFLDELETRSYAGLGRKPDSRTALVKAVGEETAAEYLDDAFGDENFSNF